jgi:hypothetical protein
MTNTNTTPTQADYDAVVAESIENLKGEEFDSDLAWEFIDLAAANLAKEGTRGASFDGLHDALIIWGDTCRLAVTDLEEVRRIVQENTL